MDTKKTKLNNMFEDTIWEIKYWWQHYIMQPIKSFFKGVNNLFKWHRIIWNDRWWDYSFMMIMLEFKLKTMEDRWGTDTHYIGDQDEKETLKKLLEDIKWLNDPDGELEDGYTEEYKKRSKRFFGRLERNHQKFWD